MKCPGTSGKPVEPLRGRAGRLILVSTAASDPRKGIVLRKAYRLS